MLDRVPVSQLATLANLTSTHRVHINRPARKHDALSSVRRQRQRGGHGQRHQQPEPVFLHRRRRDRRLHRLRHHVLPASRTWPTAACSTFVDFVNHETDSRTTTTATARTWPASSAAPASSSAKKYAGIAPGASHRLAEGARRERRRHDRRHPRGARLGLQERGRRTTSASSTCRSAPASPSLLDRPADAGDQGARRPAASRSWRRPATSARTPTGSRSGAASRRRATRPGCSRSARSARKGTLQRSDDAVAELQLGGADRGRLRARSRTSARRASASSRLAAPAQRALSDGPRSAASWLLPGSG